MTLLIPYSVGQFIDILSGHTASKSWLPILIIFVAATLLKIVVDYIDGDLYTRLQTKLAFSINTAAIHKVQQIPYNNYLLKNAAYLNERLNNDSNYISMFYINSVKYTILNGMKLFIPLVLIAFLESWLALAIVVILLLCFMVYKLFQKPIEKSYATMAEETSKFFSEEQLQVSSVKFLQTHGLNSNFIERMHSGFQSLMSSINKNNKISLSYTGIHSVLILLANLILFVVTGRSVLAGEQTIGTFTILYSYFNILIEAANYFFSFGESLEEGKVLYRRLQEVFDQTDLINNNNAPALNPISTISVDQLTFSHDPNTPLINELSASFKQGQIIGLKGSNGSGKSTFAQMMIGLHVNEQLGEICYNGISINDLNMDQMRRNQIAVCEQEPTLIPQTTLRENLCLGRSNIDDERIYQALDAVDLKTFVLDLPEQLGTVITDGSSNFSGGQKQKFALVRVLLSDSDILVFDEPSSALDLSTQAKMKVLLCEGKEARITFLVTHDNKLLDICDEILDFDQG